jgi:HD superfamily phosphodiesterase
MKISVGIVLGSTAALLVGCAGTHEVVRQAEPAYREGSIVQDQEYVDMVEHIAKQRGIDVTWINPPKRRVGDEAAGKR